MEMILALIAGGLITWLVAHYYYKRAGDELTLEAARLRHLNMLILRALEERGLAKLARDSAGEITGLHFELKAGAGVYAISGADAELTVKHRDAAV